MKKFPREIQLHHSSTPPEPDVRDVRSFAAEKDEKILMPVGSVVGRYIMNDLRVSSFDTPHAGDFKEKIGNSV